MQTLEELELIPNSEAVAILDQSGLDAPAATSISTAFGEMFSRAEEWRTKAMAIVITDTSQVDEMKEARAARLDLKSLRVKVEKTRKALKEDSLRRGKAIDGVANVFKFLVAPIEDHLKEQEEFVERLKAREQAERAESRTLELAPFIILGAPPHGFDLGALDDGTWATVLAGSKSQYANHIAAIEADKARIKAEEEERAKRVVAEAAERKRLQAEADRLQAELKAKEQAEAKLRAEAKAKQAAIEAKARAEREAIAAKEKAKRDALAAKAKAQQEAAAEKLRKEQAKVRAAKAKADELLRKQAAAKAQQEAAARQAAQAPDKEKLKAYADALASVSFSGKLTTAAGKSIAKEAVQRVANLVAHLKTAADQL